MKFNFSFKILFLCLSLLFLANCKGEEAKTEAEATNITEPSLLHEYLTLMPNTDREQQIDIELAITPEEHREGLMFRRELAENAGMLFIFSPPQRVNFWMKNTYLPLDMIFIETDGRIQKIATWTVPLSEEHIPSFSEIRAVLEINAGASAKLGLKVGDYVSHPIFNDNNASQ